MKSTLKSIIQWSLFLSLMTVGVISFMVMAGDEDTAVPMSLTRFLLTKTIALFVFEIVFIACKYFHRRGMFPEWIYSFANEED